MGIVLLILKWIGWFLLGILALVLLAVVLVLFAPIQYEMKGKQTKKWQLALRVRWLFACLSIAWHSGMEQPKIGIQFFGRAIGSKKKKKKPQPANDLIYTREKKPPKTKAQRMQQTTDTQAVSLQKDTAQQTQTMPAQDTPSQQAQTAPAQDAPAQQTQTAPAQDTPAQQTQTAPAQDTPSQQAQTAQKQNVFRRIALADIQEEAPPKAHAEEAFADDLAEDFFTGESAADVQDRLDWKGALLYFPQKRALLCAILRLFKRIFRGIRPKHFLFSGTFGTGDPVLTGELLAAAGILKAKFGDGLQITGDFARMTAENIQVQIKGHITLAYFGFAILSFVRTQPVRRLIKLYLKGRKENE